MHQSPSLRIGERSEPKCVANRRVRATKSREGDLYRLKDFESRFPPETKGMNYQFKRGRSFCERVTLLADVKSQDYLFVMAESSAGSTSTKTITRVAVSLCSKEQICFPCAKQVINNDYRGRMIGSGRRKKQGLLGSRNPRCTAVHTN